MSKDDGNNNKQICTKWFNDCFDYTYSLLVLIKRLIITREIFDGQKNLLPPIEHI